MEFVTILCLTLLLSRTTLADTKNPARIFTKGGNVLISSGDNGNIVFEPSQRGKVLVGQYELNVTAFIGPKGEKGENGLYGKNGSRGQKGEAGNTGPPGEKGEKGDIGQVGPQGYNGTVGYQGQKGDKGIQGSPGSPGINGTRGLLGPKGPTGSPGSPGFNGTRGPPDPKGANGNAGPPGPRGPQGNDGETAYYKIEDSQRITCNSSTFGILRYVSTKLQLCTPKGWRYLAFEKSEVPPCSFPNVPETNLEAFRAANPGVLFQFNKNFKPRISHLTATNITAETVPVNSTLFYEDAVMRQAVRFNGQSYLNASGISDDFWRTSNWSVMALLKFGPLSKSIPEVAVLGHGITKLNEGLHLGISNKMIIHGYYSNDIKTKTSFLFDKWYHITWTSEKALQGDEKRCIIVNGDIPYCETNTDGRYQGSGGTTVGTWWHRNNGNNLLLDNLIIVSGVVKYRTTLNKANRQLCYAKVVENNLP